MAMLANLGVPMLFFQWPLLLGALPAVIFIEAYLFRHWYALDWPRAVKGVTLAAFSRTDSSSWPEAWLSQRPS